MSKSEFEVHEAANIFPLDEERIAELAKDITKHGLLTPIETYKGQIIDGRRRLMACKKAKVEPEFTDVTSLVEDPVSYVLSRKLHRPNLTPSQLSMCADRATALREKLDGEAKERQKGGRGGKKLQANLPEAKGQARDNLGKAFGVSGRSIDYARKVRTKGIPELAQAVDEGRMAVSTAAILASEPEDAQRKAVADPKRNRRYRPGPGGSGEASCLETDKPLTEGKIRGVGVLRANEAIDCLKRIPKKDRLRKRAFQIVTDWIKSNR